MHKKQITNICSFIHSFVDPQNILSKKICLHNIKQGCSYYITCTIIYSLISFSFLGMKQGCLLPLQLLWALYVLLPTWSYVYVVARGAEHQLQ